MIRLFAFRIFVLALVETSGHRSLKALRSTRKRKLQSVSRIINKTAHSDSIGVESKMEANKMQSSLLPNQVFSGMFSNCTMNISLT